MEQQLTEHNSDGERGQVNRSAAEVYAEFFVPALFAQWTDPMLEAAGVRPGQRILDVACGTGVLTAAAAERNGAPRSVVGLDINDGMLDVARRSAPDIEWRLAPAEALPLEDERFDAVLCQFGLMFFDDRVAALKEAARVLRTGGRFAVAVWDTLNTTPGYAAMVELLQQQFGDDAADALRAPFALGDRGRLEQLFLEAGLPSIEITTQPGTARFPSLDSWLFTDMRGWTLADRIGDEEFEQLKSVAQRRLAEFVLADGQVRFPAPAHIVTGTV